MISRRSSTISRTEYCPLTVRNEVPASGIDEQRQAQLESEAEAKLISKKIDKELKLERVKQKKKSEDMNVRTTS